MKKKTNTKNIQQEMKNLQFEEMKNLQFDALVAEKKNFNHMQEIMDLEAVIIRQAKEISQLLERIEFHDTSESYREFSRECNINE
jgi:aspartate oxidase